MTILRRLSLISLSSFVVFTEMSVAAKGEGAGAPRSDRCAEIPVTLMVEGYSQPGVHVLEEARQQATMIYDAIGVSLAWINGQEAPASTDPIHIVAAVLSGARTDRFLKGRDVPETVLGVAPYQTGRVYVFWDRIARRAREDEVLPQIVLGRVLAHEIGHHLLPLKGHSDDGLMRRSLNYKMLAPPTFSAAEAQAIRTLLSHALP